VLRNVNEITSEIIGGAIAVHRELGPGLLESTYEACLALELTCRGLEFEVQRWLPIMYRGTTIENAYRIDLWVENSVVVELKAVEMLLPVHESQVLSYLRLSGCRFGLLINFNVSRLVDGVRRLAWGFDAESSDNEAR
jgi:GxxExxY protein